MRLRPFVLMLLVLTIVFSSTGCTTLQQETEAPIASSGSEQFWWRIRFRLNWPADTDPDLSYHLLIADQLFAPLLEQYENELTLWRFHRRAARDKAGHQFSFIHYSKSQTAKDLHQQVESNPLIKQLITDGLIERLRFTTRPSDSAGLVEATSDPSWPIEIQQSWPQFIQGVSASWLDLIAREKEAANLNLSGQRTTAELISAYQQLAERVRNKWGRHGQHAYLHHLNAIFGYAPVYIYQSESWQRF